MAKHRIICNIFSVLMAFILLVHFVPPLQTHAESISLHVWVSNEAMGTSPDFFSTGDRCYLCYELTDSNGNYIEGYDGYNVNMKIFNPDGSVKFEYDYSDSSNNWISTVMSETGYFDGLVSVTGNIEVSCGVTGRVIPSNVDVSTWLSRTGMGAELDTDKETIYIGDDVYFCYKMVDSGTDNLINDCCDLEITQKFVSPTGEVFDCTYDNNNNWYCITPGMAGTWKYYLVINGDYDAELSGSFDVVSKTDFLYGRDNWSFNNSGDNFTHSNYFLNSNDLSRLYNGLTLTEKARMTFRRLEGWGGSCYGMTALATLIKGSEISSTSLPGQPKHLFKTTNPNSNSNVESAINYYQLLQNTNLIQQHKAMYARISQAEIIDEITIKTQVYNCNVEPFLLAFSGTFWGTDDGGHAVMVYDYEDGTYTWNNRTYNKKFLIYDPNSVEHDERRCLYVNTSTDAWCIPSYQLGSNQNNGRLSYVISSYDILNHHGLYSDSTSRIATDEFYSVLSVAALNSKISIGKIKEEAGGFSDSTISVDDEIEVFYDVFGEDVTTSTFNAVLPENNAGYVFKTNESDNYNIQMNYENLLYYVKAENGKKVTFFPNGECNLNSDGGRSSINAVFNNQDECPISYSNIQFESVDTTYINFGKKYEMIVVESDSLINCNVSSVTDYETNLSTSLKFSSNGKKAYIYQKEENLEVQVVGDLNNDYKISVSDAVILQKWLLAQKVNMPEIWRAADLCEDDVIDCFDLIMLKRMLINQ